MENGGTEGSAQGRLKNPTLSVSPIFRVQTAGSGEAVSSNEWIVQTAGQPAP